MKKCIAMLLVATLLFSTTFGLAEKSAVRTSKLREILTEAFSGTELLDVVDIPYGTETIDFKAFANTGAEKIYIPRTVSSIADNAFDGTDIVIAAPAFSYAHTYAEEHGLAWEDSGDHYPQNSIEAAADILSSGFQLEAMSIEPVPLLPTDGVTDPAKLELIKEYNTLAQDMQQRIDICNDTSSFSAAIEPLNALYKDFAITEEDNSVVFTYGAGQLVMDSSLYEHFQAGYAITEGEVSEDGSRMTLMAGDTEYVVQTSGTTITLSASDGAPAAIQRLTVQRSSNQTLKTFQSTLQVIGKAYAGINYWLALQLEHLNECINMSMKLSQYYQKIGIYVEGEYSNRLILLIEKEKMLVKCQNVLTALAIPVQIANGYTLVQNWQEINEIGDHNHPTEHDLSEEALQTSETLNREILALQILYATDAVNSIMGLAASVATIVNAAAAIAVPPPQVKAVCAYLTASTGTTALVSFGLGLGISYLESSKYKAILELDRNLHTTVYGTVCDAMTGQPLQHVAVSCGGAAAWTDSVGAYEIYLQPGNQLIQFKVTGYQPKEVSVIIEKGQNIQKNIELQPVEVMVSGMIQDADTGSALANAVIQCGDCKTTSAQDGSYQIMLPIGMRKISFSADGYAEQSVTLVLEEGKNTVQNVKLTSRPDPAPASDFTYTSFRREITITKYLGSSKVVSIPSTIKGYPVTKLETSAFLRNKNVEKVIIPDSVIKLESYTTGEGVFYDCVNLKSVVLPNGLSSIPVGTFGHCFALSDVIIPESVTSIETDAFYQCWGLTGLVIPDSVESIADGAFYDCHGLTSIVLPNRITSIESQTFANCYALKSVTIPDNVSTIANYAFAFCYALETVVIPKSVTSISENAFTGCDALKTAYVESQQIADYFAEHYPHVQVVWR